MLLESDADAEPIAEDGDSKPSVYGKLPPLQGEVGVSSLLHYFLGICTVGSNDYRCLIIIGFSIVHPLGSLITTCC